jgi:hypothetical protein
MKITTLTGPVAHYIAAANVQDVDVVAATFCEAAVVRDEGQSLTGRVSGDFPGSPIDLRYVFTLTGGRIERLEIS